MRPATTPPTGRRQWAGIGVGAVAIVAGFLASLLTFPRDPIPGLLAATFAGGVVAGALSNGGARSGAVSGFLSGVFGFGVLALWLFARIFLEELSRAATGGNDFGAGLALIVLPFMGAAILVITLAGGSLGGGLGRLLRPWAAKADL